MQIRKANMDEVICPNCVHQFRAIPLTVQAQLSELTTCLHGAVTAMEWLLASLEGTSDYPAVLKLLQRSKAALEKEGPVG